MHQEIWFVLYLGATVLLAVTVWVFFRSANNTIISTYRHGVELAGSMIRGRVVYRIVQWRSDFSDPRPCPLVLHLPKGDLGGDALCNEGAPAAAERLDSTTSLDLFPYYQGTKVVGVRVGLLPGGPRVEVSVAGVRLTLPLSEVEAVRLLGEPIRRVVYDSLGRPQSTGE